MGNTQEDLHIRPFTVDDASWAIDALMARGLNGCECAFANMFLWRHYSGNVIAEIGDSLFFASNDPVLTFSTPIKGDFKTGIERLKAYTRAQGIPLQFYGSRQNLTEELERYFPGEFDFKPSEPDFDYLYNAQDLINLSGRAYHGKRNHIAAFSKQYNWEYAPITDADIEDVLAMAKEWYAQREYDEQLKAEQDGLEEILRHREKLQVKGGLLRVDGQVVAFTLGAPISDVEFDVMVEKALPKYNGAYATINREFAAHELGEFLYINRENDMGAEGVRRAKRSYRPIELIEKFICVERR